MPTRWTGGPSRGGPHHCNLTGHGLKQPEAIPLSEKEFTPIMPTLEALRLRVRDEG